MTVEKNAATPWIRVAANHPEAELDAFLQNQSEKIDGEVLLVVDFNFVEYWRDENNSIALTALFFLHESASLILVAVLRTEQFNLYAEQFPARPEQSQNNNSALSEWLHALPISLFSIFEPVPLLPVSIPKPWGQEIWYTGIEKRGVVEVGIAGRSVPLPWLLAVAPQRFTHGVQQPILLKILDPLPEPVFGDLYFELHREKQEVYVVTAIDLQAWPSGVGAIRFGFNAEQRRNYRNDEDFIAEYLKAVRDYRAVRVQIDAQLDVLRARDGIELNAPVSAQVLAAWLQEIDSALQQQENSLRAQMESFTELMPLQVGDVVKVPCLLPHSLQHGVRTVEFQTPVYERLILSFAQKVLTQAHWDTEEAATILQLDPAPAGDFPLIEQGEGWSVEQIVEFDDFEVHRIRLEPGAQLLLKHGRSYALGMAVGQPLFWSERCMNPDDAVLFPTKCQAHYLRNETSQSAYFLLALPLV